MKSKRPSALRTRRTARPYSRRVFAFFLGVVTALAVSAASEAAGASRIKDLADFEGVRDNILVGYGLVVGLNGTGDSLRNSAFTRSSLAAMLERLGVAADAGGLNTRNVAAVMVTSVLPPFARQGSRLDVTVSALGDASSLQGGVLVATPLLAADGAVYAVAQGGLSVGGFAAEGDGGSVTRGVPTGARAANAAIVEREAPFVLDDMRSVRIALRNPDLTTAVRVAEAIDARLGDGAAKVADGTTVELVVPRSYRGRVAEFLAVVERLPVEPDQPARILIDEGNGVIVMGENVRISKVAIAQGNLTVRITENPQVSQPQPFAENGETVVVPNTQIAIEEDGDRKMVVLQAGVTLDRLVDGLNALGVGPRDMINIIQAIKAAGALQADIELL